GEPQGVLVGGRARRQLTHAALETVSRPNRRFSFVAEHDLPAEQVCVEPPGARQVRGGQLVPAAGPDRAGGGGRACSAPRPARAGGGGGGGGARAPQGEPGAPAGSWITAMRPAA